MPYKAQGGKNIRTMSVVIKKTKGTGRDVVMQTKLYSPFETKETALNTCCPTCSTRIVAPRICPNHHAFEPADVSKMYNGVVITKDELDLLAVNTVDGFEVADFKLMSRLAYKLQFSTNTHFLLPADSMSEALYVNLIALMEEMPCGMTGKYSVKGQNEKCGIIHVGTNDDGQKCLVLREVPFHDDIRSFPLQDNIPGTDAAVQKLLSKLVKSKMDKVSDSEIVDVFEEQLKLLIASKNNGVLPEKPKAKGTLPTTGLTSSEMLLQMLQQSVEQATPSPAVDAAARRTTIKRAASGVRKKVR